MNPLETAQEAIRARLAGEYDNAVLQSFGPLSTAPVDIQHIKTECLRAYGFTVGIRDPRVNTDYPGLYMVVEDLDDATLPTRDGSNGPWAVVGDDLCALVDCAFEVVGSWD